MAKSLLPSLRESARHVVVVQLDARGGMVPMHISSIGSPLTPSSLWDTISRCSEVVDAIVYWRLLVAFLSSLDGDEQVCIIGHEEGDLYRAKPVECATVEKQPTSPPEREAPTLPSERWRLQKEAKAAEKRAQLHRELHQGEPRAHRAQVRRRPACSFLCQHPIDTPHHSGSAFRSQSREQQSWP